MAVSVNYAWPSQSRGLPISASGKLPRTCATARPQFAKAVTAFQAHRTLLILAVRRVFEASEEAQGGRRKRDRLGEAAARQC
jgi:hypothetical protein